MLTRKGLRRLATVWVVGVAAVSIQPWRPVGESQSVIGNVWHFGSFGAAAIMFFALSRNVKQISIAAIGILCMAMAIEISQHLLYLNPIEWWDVRDDTIGVAFAWMLLRWTGIKSLLLNATDTSTTSR